MIFRELYISPEMLAEGVEAMRESKTNCLTEVETALTIYLAMAEIALKTEGEATLQ